MAAAQLSEILPLLISPARLAIDGEEHSLVLAEGTLTSADGDSYPIIDGIPDLRLSARNSKVGANSYADIHGNFSPREVSAEEVDRQVALLDVTPELVAGKIVLLGGTGMGLQLPVLLRHGPKLVVSLDYSDHIRNVARQYADCPVVFVQGDLMNLPFRSGSFDLCFNAGVMQQVRSPELAFRQLHRVTRRGGAISIGALYDYSLKHRLVNAHRYVMQFSKMSYADARARLEKIVRNRRFFEKLGLYRLHYWMSGRFVVPFTAKHTFDFQMDQTMDWYYPEYRHLLSDDEIRSWFRDVGIAEVQRGRRQFIGIRN